MAPKKKAEKVELTYSEPVDETDVLALNLYSDINDNFFNEASRVRDEALTGKALINLFFFLWRNLYRLSNF